MQSVLIRPQVAIASPVGQINAANAAEFQSQLNAIVLSDDNSAVVVDMSQVKLLDSAGLMVLVAALRLAQSRNKRFSLCAVSPSIRIIFELTQLDRAFEMVDDIAAFEKAMA